MTAKLWEGSVEVYDPKYYGPERVRRPGGNADSAALDSDDDGCSEDAPDVVDDIDCFAAEAQRLQDMEQSSSSDEDPLWGEAVIRQRVWMFPK